MKNGDGEKMAKGMTEPALEEGAGEGAATGAAIRAVDGGGERKYSASQVVCLECEHIREMRGETDEVVRRTRSEAAENAVLNAVREGGVEPDWFVERWVQGSSARGDGVLVACAVFEDAGKCAGFRAAVNGYVNKLEARGDESPVRIRSDAALEAAVAEHFSAEWSRQRAEQMGKYGRVLGDAKASGKWAGRILVGEYRAVGGAGGEKGRNGEKDAKGAKAVFAKVCEELNEAFPHDEFGEGGIAYSGYWDEGGVARFCFGFGDGFAAAAARDRLGEIGAVTYDPMEREAEGVELEMAALVIAKVQGEENAKAAREEMAKEAGKAAKEGAEKGLAEAAAKAME